MFDLHCHSNNSFDSKEPLNSMIDVAIEKEVKYIAFTEHYSTNRKKKTFGYFNLNKYLKEIEIATQTYGHTVTILKALEICEPHLENSLPFAKENFDFILGSVHNIGDLGLREVALNNEKEKAYNLYFKEYLNMVTFGDFTIAAHLDLMNRYAFNTLENYNFTKHKTIIEKILKVIIKRGKGIEVNTSGLRKNLKATHPSVDILKLYKELGGEIITIGSDAHKAEDVFKDCSSIIRILKNLGFSAVYTFKDFKPIKHKI